MTDPLQYKRSRVVVAHTMAPWNLKELQKQIDVSYHIPQDETDTIRKSTRIPKCECHECTTTTESQESYAKEKFSDYYKISPSTTGELSAHQYMIMAPYMFAFSLKDRSWGKSTHRSICFSLLMNRSVGCRRARRTSNSQNRYG